MPIDIFFRSLAEDQHNNAVGVILSGTASDGTLGLTAIKGEGGITFAQDSKTAKYDGMPSSAVASGAVNEEMQHRNQQLSQLNNDLTNLLNSVNIAIVMLGPDLSVRRYTTQAEKMLGLSSIDVGRPITNLRLKVNIANLEESVLDVIRDVVPKQQEFQDHHGSRYNLRITPYRTSDNKIEGAVLVLLETTDTRTPKSK